MIFLCDFCQEPNLAGVVVNGYHVCVGCYADQEENRREDAWASGESA